MITKYLIVFLISMVPLIELRGAIPYAVAFHIPTLPAYLIAVIGNMLPAHIIHFISLHHLNMHYKYLLRYSS